MDLFDLAAKITLDSSEYENGIKKASGETDGFGSKIKKAFSVIGKMSLAAVGAAATGISAIVKQSVSAYGEYEQLAGGVETLFGSSANKVMEDAKQAFKTAGMSANEYMETSIQSAASLINSLGGDQEKAAKLMNMSITDMADNVNKMGTSMEAVQNAYRGFSRGNFTMLDNLALGFAGTKEGMQELLEKAQEISGVKYDISSYSDIVEAIHVVQSEMGITGTTAKEASETIQGSLSSAKSAWENLVTGLSDSNADVSQLVTDFISSAGTVAKNIIPVVKQALSGIGDAVSELAPAITSGLAEMIPDVLPGLIKSAITLVTELAKALVDNVDSVIDAAFQIINILVESLSDPNGLILLIDAAFTIIQKLADGLTQNLPVLIPAVVDIILQLAEKLVDPQNITMIMGAATDIMLALIDGIMNSLPDLLARAPEIIMQFAMAMINMKVQLFMAAVKLIMEFILGLASVGEKLVTNGKEIVNKVWNGVKQKLEDAKKWGKDLIQNFISGLTAKWEALKSKVSGIAQGIKNLLGFSEPKEGPLSDFHTYAPDMMQLFAKGVTDNADMLKNVVSDAFDFSDKTVQPQLAVPEISSRIVPDGTTFSTTGGGTMAQVLQLLQMYLPELLKRDVVLDTGATVGALAPAMDYALGRRVNYAARGHA